MVRAPGRHRVAEDAAAFAATGARASTAAAQAAASLIRRGRPGACVASR